MLQDNKKSRLKEIITVFVKHGIINKSKLLQNPVKVRCALEELGPTFVKLGQILSTRPDLLPADFINEFKNNYKKTDKYDEIVKYIYSLKDKAKLVLFSDLIFTCFGALEKQINLDIFDEIFLSYKEGCTKSNIEAFINVENKLNVEEKDILFIDNNVNNINNAKKRGWNTCLAYGFELEKIKNSVEDFLKKK